MNSNILKLNTCPCMNDESGCIFEIKKFGWLDVVLEKGGHHT